MSNIMLFESLGLTYLDSPISVSNNTTPRQVILNLKKLVEEIKEEKIFISVEKNKNRNFILYYKKKFYRDVSIIVEYLATVMVK